MFGLSGGYKRVDMKLIRVKALLPLVINDPAVVPVVHHTMLHGATAVSWNAQVSICTDRACTVP